MRIALQRPFRIGIEVVDGGGRPSSVNVLKRNHRSQPIPPAAELP